MSMADDTTTNGVKVDATNWTIDVQRGLAWTIVIIFSVLLVILAIRVIVSGAATDSLELLKQGVNALINIVMMVMGYFFGSSKSSQSKDDTQNKIVEKLTSTAPPGPPGPIAPVPGPAVVVAWWSLLTDAEKAAITAAALTDARVSAFVTASAVGKASVEDLAYLVTAGLLTEGRATAIQST